METGPKNKYLTPNLSQVRRSNNLFYSYLLYKNVHFLEIQN